MKNSLGESSINLVGLLFCFYCSNIPIFSYIFWGILFWSEYIMCIQSHHDNHFLSFNIKENWLFLRRLVEIDKIQI